MKTLNDLMDLTLREILENYVSIQSLECGYFYGVAPVTELEKIDKKYDLKTYLDENGETFYVNDLIHHELLLDDSKPLLTAEKLSLILDNLDVPKKEEGK